MMNSPSFVAALSDEHVQTRRDATHQLFLFSTIEKSSFIITASQAVLLMTLLKDTDNEVKRNTVCILTNLAAEVENKIMIANAGGIITFITLLSDPDEDIRHLAGSALFNCLTEFENQIIFMNGGGLAALLPLLHDEESDVRIDTVKTLERLMRESNFQLQFLKEGHLLLLMHLLKDSEEDVHTSVILILLQFAINTRTQPYLITTDIIPTLQVFADKKNRLIRAWTKQILDICQSSLEAFMQTKQNKLMSVIPQGLFSEHSRNIYSLTMLPNGQMASGGDSGMILLWDIEHIIPVVTFKHTGGVIRLIGLPNDLLVSGSTDSTMKWWNYLTGVCIRTYSEDINNIRIPDIRAMTVLSNNKFVSAHDKKIKVWPIAGDKYEMTLRDFKGDVTALIGLPNGQLASAYHLDNAITLWNVSRGKLATTFLGHTKPIVALAMLQNGQLASGSVDATIKFWDIQSGTCVRTLLGHDSPVTKLVTLLNDQLVSINIKTIKVWAIACGTCVATLQLTHFINTMIALPDGRFVISERLDGMTRNPLNVIALNSASQEKQAITPLTSIQEISPLHTQGMFSQRARVENTTHPLTHDFNRDKSLAEFYTSTRPCNRHRLL